MSVSSRPSAYLVRGCAVYSPSSASTVAGLLQGMCNRQSHPGEPIARHSHRPRTAYPRWSCGRHTCRDGSARTRASRSARAHRSWRRCRPCLGAAAQRVLVRLPVLYLPTGKLPQEREDRMGVPLRDQVPAVSLNSSRDDSDVGLAHGQSLASARRRPSASTLTSPEAVALRRQYCETASPIRPCCSFT